MKRSLVFTKDRSSRISQRIHKTIEKTPVCRTSRLSARMNKFPRLAGIEKQGKINSLVCKLS